MEYKGASYGCMEDEKRTRNEDDVLNHNKNLLVLIRKYRNNIEDILKWKRDMFIY